MKIEGGKVTLHHIIELELLGVSNDLEVDKQYDVYEGGEFIGAFTRRAPQIASDKQIIMGGDFIPVHPVEYVELKFKIEE